MSYRYKNESKTDQVVVGFGVAKAGEEIITDRPIESPNFKYLGEADKSSVTAVTGPQPNAVTEGERVNNVTDEGTN